MNLPFPSFFFPLLTLIIAANSSAFATEPITLTSTAGKSIRATLISIDATADSVTYRRTSDGKIFASKFGIFDETTQHKLQKEKNTGNESGQMPLKIDVTAQDRLIYDQKNGEWKEAVISNVETGPNNLLRSVFTLKNRSTQDVANLKIDIAIVIGPDKGDGEMREERQTFSILRMKALGDIIVQSKLYPLQAGDDDGQVKESVKGTVIRLRDEETGETVFSWKSDKLSMYAVNWDQDALQNSKLASHSPSLTERQ